MANLKLNLDDLTNAALKRLVQQLLEADDKEERAIMNGLKAKAHKNDLADLHEEQHGKPDTPMVEDNDDDMSDCDDMPCPPKKKGKK